MWQVTLRWMREDRGVTGIKFAVVTNLEHLCGRWSTAGLDICTSCIVGHASPVCTRGTSPQTLQQPQQVTTTTFQQSTMQTKDTSALLQRPPELAKGNSWPTEETSNEKVLNMSWLYFTSCSGDEQSDHSFFEWSCPHLPLRASSPSYSLAAPFSRHQSVQNTILSHKVKWSALFLIPSSNNMAPAPRFYQSLILCQFLRILIENLSLF